MIKNTLKPVCDKVCVTWEDGSGVDPGPVIHRSAVDGKVHCACNKDARALRVDIVKV